ncbi:pentatricopeptide repeat-containing protein At1g80150, mitochondrial-like [Actinidia eriantha]|uniref:pentatricopeptide repeat-containing protein At1g80150, mitochondrial-like n=1 Tax=Actinidia eriantha TaxID=165200 RepID=UPI002589A4FF|nr:pentatricopeptide repeat-containing protein At1g80150, mitochondrial-like [Actinidia eriantha]XP_057467871.1 pentatricopeptide repeat-containing protein At1g80150, mitochondrial-like [Actinidia eriantha]XP_057467872.1 pentatricopeptide repeat-containing protein At1g80150, mitochondrial-like [Actinidia eriantha]XP_057467873.1 pentatricopeptide repeat-containing protein At1g80150, mitochondrial-like [Actinidia eriantha]XP_057467874.1 pentatricopeptide repeat-containing protein At1g80150, mitoc
MLALRLGRKIGIVRKFGTANHALAAAIVSTNTKASNTVANLVPNTVREPISVEEPALVKLKAERDPEKLFHLFKANAHNRLVIENRFAFEDTVSRLAGAGRLDYIENLLEHQKTLSQGRREGFIVRIIMLYGKAEMIKHAVDTFYNMHLYGCRRTVKSFNAALTVLTQTRDLEAMESFLTEVPWKFGIEIDIFSVNIVIKAFCEMSILDKACFIMVQMEKLGLSPDVYTYTTLISAFYKNNQVEIGNGLWNLMLLKGCFPSLATFNIRIQFLVSRGRAWQANSLMDMMWYLRIPPDLVTYNLVIKGFCQAGYLGMAQRVYSALHHEGYKPNLKIYQTMIHYLCKGGNFNMAYTMCKDSMTKNWFPNVDTICKLLEGLQVTGELGKASYIMALAKKRVPPLTADQLNALRSILQRS